MAGNTDSTLKSPLEEGKDEVSTLKNTPVERVMDLKLSIQDKN